MDIGKFLDENYIKEEIPVENIYQPEMSDLPKEELIQPKEENKSAKMFFDYTFKNWKRLCSKALMSGYHSKEILARYKTNVKVANNENEIKKYLKGKDGLVGSLIVDCSCFDKTFSYNKCSSRLSKYHRFAINCNCSNFEENEIRKNSSNGSIDGLLAEEQKVIKSKKEVCKVCGLPVIHSLKEISSEVLINVVDELVSNGEITNQEGNNIKSSKDILSSLRFIFANKVGRYKISNPNTKIDTSYSKYSLKGEKLEANSIKANKDLSIKDIKEETKISEEINVVPLDCLFIEEVPKETIKEEVEVIEPKNINVENLKEETEYKEDLGLNPMDCLFIEENPETFENDLELNPQKDEIEFDNDEYIDGDWFDKESVELTEEDLKKRPKDIDISNDYSFDF